MTLSTKPISPVDRWPATKGAARIALVRTSATRRGAWDRMVMAGSWQSSCGDRAGAGSGTVAILASDFPFAADLDDCSSMTDPSATTVASDAATDQPPAACQNCGAPLLGPHCYACGQPVSGLVRHFTSIIGDALDSILNIDARVFRTCL